MNASLGAGHRVHLVDDHGLHVGQRVAGGRGQHQEERLRRGDEDVGRTGDELAAACRRGVARTDPDADARVGQAEALGGPGDAGQRSAQVAFDVHGQRLERRHVEDPGPGGVLRLGRQPVDRPQECRQRLARPGGGDHQGVVAVGDRRPRLRLCRRGRLEGVGEPLPGGGGKPAELGRAGVLGVHMFMVPTTTDRVLGSLNV